MDLNSIKEVRAAIRSAREVLVQARFGCSERWLKISKREALYLIQGLSGPPEQNEMYAGSFGELRGDQLYLG